MPTAMPSPTIAASITDVSTKSLRPVLLTVLSLKLAVATFLLLSVVFSPPLSAESRYLAGDVQTAATN